MNSVSISTELVSLHPDLCSWIRGLMMQILRAMEYLHASGASTLEMSHCSKFQALISLDSFPHEK